MNNKTVVIAPAIKTKFWQGLYKQFCKAKTPFHFVFVGHIQPDFKLPDNFTYIKCKYNAAECAEIAFRYAYKHVKDAKVILTIADDTLVPNFFLDNLIKFYDEQAKKYNNEFMLVGPMYNGHLDQENLMSLHQGGPILLGPMLTTIENSKKIGGLDRRFSATYWDCDRHLRAQAQGGVIVFSSAIEIPPVKEVEYLTQGGLWKKYGSIDRAFLDELWSVKEGGEQEIFCSSLRPVNGRSTNVIEKRKLILERKDKVIEYDDFYLGKYYE